MVELHVFGVRMNRSLNRRLNCRLNGYTTTLAPGARRANGMTEVSKVFREYFRWRKRFAKLMPDFFDYVGAERRAREESDRRVLEIELNAALDKVYGPFQRRINSPPHEAMFSTPPRRSQPSNHESSW